MGFQSLVDAAADSVHFTAQLRRILRVASVAFRAAGAGFVQVAHAGLQRRERFAADELLEFNDFFAQLLL